MCLHTARPAWTRPYVKQLQVICKPGLTAWDISCAGEHTSTRSRQLLWLQQPPCACSSRSSHMRMCWCSQLASYLPSTNCTSMTWIRPAMLQQGWRNLSVSCKSLGGRWEQPQSYYKTQHKVALPLSARNCSSPQNSKADNFSCQFTFLYLGTGMGSLGLLLLFFK